MTIRWKIGALLALLLGTLSLVALWVASSVLMPSFADLERSEADVAMQRVRHALDRSMGQLAVSANSWGNWVDTYRFARDHNRTFVNENITIIGLQQLDVNAILVLDTNGHPLASGTLDLESGKPLDVDLLGRVTSRADFPWRGGPRDDRPVQGLVQTPRGVLLMAAAPILDGFGRGPARGMVVMGRLLSAGEITGLSHQAQAALSVTPPLVGMGRKRVVVTESRTSVYESLDDIYGQPALTLRVDVPREITIRGRSAVRYATAWLLGTAVIAVILLILVLNKVVLNPLSRVTGHAVRIGENADLTNRLDFDRRDEIGMLAREFDRMVARVAESRSQLVDQSFQAGLGEQAKGVLHNLGNAMTPVGVRLAMLHNRLRSIDREDFELAAAELSSADLDPTRRLDLAELVHLASSALTATLREAEQDVEVITRQTSLVQSALAEQMHAARSEHVWEAVRLTDLLAQSIEVVPDASRRSLRLETDDSVGEVGVIFVPRTLLRLVLQNLIINAADSVTEAGRMPGCLRISAQLILAAGATELILQCVDDGVGIPGDSLPRIFEKGYSTKSRETNFGIGLHWCANALGALGGRIWATSEGIGRGASLHVQLPLRTPPDCIVMDAA